jgi:hypothetical protein
MLAYETLDAIADAVNPTLLIATLLLPAWPRPRAAVGGFLRWYACVAGILIVVYGIMALDTQLGIWHSIGADYSTHTAFALGLSLLWYAASRTAFAVICLVLLAYIGLMLYQRYHTLMDMFTTAVPISAAALALISINRRARTKDVGNEI